jgi:hypothetical protein
MRITHSSDDSFDAMPLRDASVSHAWIRRVGFRLRCRGVRLSPIFDSRRDVGPLLEQLRVSALDDGHRESTESWLDLRGCERRGMAAPVTVFPA